MSRWLSGLSQVSNLLEKLDGTVENVVEERVIASDDADVALDNQVIIDDILSKRGLEADLKDEIEEATDEMEDGGNDEMEDGGNNDAVDLTVNDNVNNEVNLDIENQNSVSDNDSNNKNNDPNVNSVNIVITNSLFDSAKAESSEPRGDDHLVSTSGEMQLPDHEQTEQEVSAITTSLTLSEPGEPNSMEGVKGVGQTKEESAKPSGRLATVPANPTTGKVTIETEASMASKEAQKEVRVLRRHIVKLNSTLEQAEGEIMALRDELERAAERMEKDRSRAKDLKEAAQKRHAEELAANRKQHDQALKEQQSRFEEQLETYKSKLHELEHRRKQEGGDWNKEIAQAYEREQQMSNRVALLEDEKTVLLNQISTLQSQQVALCSRVESLTQTSENAMTREREAEDRLDAVLSQHARQISQRQAREAELERTIHQLNSALAARANKDGTLPSQVSDKASAGDSSLMARIEALERDLNASHSQLALEKERSEMLHIQLKEMSKESTQEATSTQVQQLQYERRVAEMTLTISRLEASLRDAQNETYRGEKLNNRDPSDEELAQQVKLLSEEVVRLRDNLGNSSSELKTLKSRLQGALERATKAEDELASATALVGSDMYDSMELGSGNRESLSATARRRKPTGLQNSTIRAAMRLTSAQGDRTEQLAKVVDAVDGFAVTTGKYLRKNPMARAGFIVYLLLIHIWTFVLLFLHAHNFETLKADDIAMAVGPHALIDFHKRNVENVAPELQRGGT